MTDRQRKRERERDTKERDLRQLVRNRAKGGDNSVGKCLYAGTTKLETRKSHKKEKNTKRKKNKTKAKQKNNKKKRTLDM